MFSRHGRDVRGTRPGIAALAAICAVAWAAGAMGAESPGDASGTAVSDSYTSVRIASPSAQATVHDNNDSLVVEVAIEPPLQVAAGDRVLLVVDGARTAMQTGNRFALSKMYRGTHTVQAVVVDSGGRVLTTSAPVSFYMWHASALFPNRAP